MTRDVVVIGGGVNGLTCAAYLAKAGFAPLVLEATESLGGGAATAELARGFHAPVLSHSTGPLRADVIDYLQLEQHGLESLAHDVSVTALGDTPQPLVIYEDVSRTSTSLRTWSERDAAAWPRFVSSIAAIGRVIGRLYDAAPAPIDEPTGRDLWSLLRTLRAFKSLNKADAYRLLRWGPMAVADLVTECFESERLRAAVAADGILGTRYGPWSAGSGLVLLLRAANEAVAARQSFFVRGGPGAIASALQQALLKAGGEVRTRARVSRVLVRDGRARGVVLADGEEIAARAVVSAVDPKQTFLRLCDPMDLSPEFLWRMRNYRTHGTLAKVNLALSALPTFTGVDREALTGRIRICPDVDYLERAYDHSKYGRYSPEPYVELTLPSLVDASLAPSGAHVLSAYVQFAPYEIRRTAGSGDQGGTGFTQSSGDQEIGLTRRSGDREIGLTQRSGDREIGLTQRSGDREIGLTQRSGDREIGPTRRSGDREGVGLTQGHSQDGSKPAAGNWDQERDNLTGVVLDTIERFAPGLRSLIVAQQTITPLDLERTYGLTGGHIFHGELALDQLLTMRPLLGWGQYRTPIPDLYLCGSGTHPGTGLTGGSGANAAREIARHLR